MKKFGHHAPFQHPWRRAMEKQSDWTPMAVAFRISLPEPQAPAPVAVEPAAPAAPAPPPGPPPFDPRSITLENVLRTFQNLANPQSRVFGGYFRPNSDQAPGDPFPMVSGIATPGSKVQVVFSDDAGIRQQDTQVHSDVQGYWMASMRSGSKLLPPKWVQVSITPPSWSGSTEALEFLVSFPGEELTTSGHIRGIAAGGLIGSVLPVMKKDEAPTGIPAAAW